MSKVNDIKLLQSTLIPDNTSGDVSPKDVRDAEALPLDNWREISAEQIGDTFDFSTYANMIAIDGVENVVYKVSNDPDSSKNGYYHWTGSAYVKDAELNGGVVALGETEAVTGERIKRVIISKAYGKNLFNKDDVEIVAGHYISSNQNIQPNATYNVTGFIEVEEGETYVKTYTNSAAIYTNFYDSKFDLLPSPTNALSFTVPVGAKYIRTTYIGADEDEFQVEKGNVATAYSGYTEFYEAIGTEALKDLAVTTEKIADKAVTEDKLGGGSVSEAKIIDEAVTERKTVFFEASKNLFNIGDPDIAIDYYVRCINGNLALNTSYNATGFIPIVGGQTYTRSYEHQTAFYDSNKDYISGICSGEPLTFVAPINAAYVRCTVGKAAWAEFQLEEGTESTSFEPYGYLLKEKYLPEFPSQFINEVASPLKQYVLDNYENSRYFKAMFRRFRPQDESYRIEGGEWLNGAEFARVTNPTVETAGVDVKVYNIEFEEIASVSFDVVIGNQATDNGLVNGVFIGDSLSYNGSYIVKINTLLSNLAWDGIRASYSAPNPLGEGRGGWRLASYFENLTGSSTDSFTPFMHPVAPYVYYGGSDFWKAVVNGSTDYGVNGFQAKAAEIGFDAVTGLLIVPSVDDCMYNNANARYERWNGSAWVEILESTLNFSFNFAKYRSTWNVTQPDIVSVMLGTNDFRSQASEAAIDSFWSTWSSRMEELVASVRADNPAAKIAIMIAPSVTGILDNVNGDFTTKQGAMMWYSRKLIIQDFDDREDEGIYLVDAGTSLDPVYGVTLNENLPFSDFTNTQRRLVQSNTPHPSTDGYYQLGIPLAAWIQSIR